MTQHQDDAGPMDRPLDRVLVYATTDGSHRTKTVPWATTLPAAQTIEVHGVTYTLVADSRVVDPALVELDYQQMRVRAWNATRGSKEAA